jgi:hypothetical protein
MTSVNLFLTFETRDWAATAGTMFLSLRYSSLVIRLWWRILRARRKAEKLNTIPPLLLLLL